MNLMLTPWLALAGNLALVLFGTALAVGAILALSAVVWRMWKSHRASDILESTVASLPQGIITVDLAGRIVQLNPAAATLIGLSETDALRTEVHTLFGLTAERMLELTAG